MLQRTTKWLPKLKKALPDLNFKFSLPSVTDANVGAANGIADLQEYHDMDPKDLIQGKVQNFLNGKIYISNSKLTPSETLKIATAAREAGKTFVN